MKKKHEEKEKTSGLPRGPSEGTPVRPSDPRHHRPLVHCGYECERPSIQRDRYGPLTDPQVRLLDRILRNVHRAQKSHPRDD